MKKIIILFSLLFIGCTYKEYTVEVSYCDGREKDTIIIESCLGEPDNGSIDNYKTAVPEFAGYMNVCNVRTIK